MANTLDKIRAAIAEHEAELVELRAAERVVGALDTQEQPATMSGGWTSVNHATGAVTAHEPKTIGAAITAALADGPQNLSVILERVNATGRTLTDQAVSSALQVLKRKNLVVRKGRMWRIR